MRGRLAWAVGASYERIESVFRISSPYRAGNPRWESFCTDLRIAMRLVLQFDRLNTAVDL